MRNQSQSSLAQRLAAAPGRTILLFILALLALYALSLSWTELPGTLKGGIREVQFVSGALAYILAALMVITAARPRFLERLIPLDRYYLLHKDLGLACVILVCIHFFAKDIGSTILPMFFTFEPAPPRTGGSSGGYSLRRFAEDTGLYLTYLSLILVLLTFIKTLPYRLWQRTHRLFPAIFILMILHCLVLTENYQFSNILSWVYIIFMLTALPFAVLALLGRSGCGSRHTVTVADLKVSPDYLTLKLQAPDALCQPGRFLLLKLPHENPHPFTIAAAENGVLTLKIKNSGCIAGKVQNLAQGAQLSAEGPYGRECFILPQAGEQALWVMQGSGMAQLNHALNLLEREPLPGKVTLLLLIRSAPDSMYQELKTRLDQALERCGDKLQLRVHCSAVQGRIKAQQLCALSSQADRIVCCGSSALKAQLRRGFISSGGKPCCFKAEYTAWRSFKPFN